MATAKGALTIVADATTQEWRHEGGITGLAARGATLKQAATWGVALHAMAGEINAIRGPPFLHGLNRKAVEPV